MKAIILAAGMGKRLGPYTKEMPKGMLNFLGVSLIGRQIETYRRCGIDRIILVGGYRADRLNFPETKLYLNENYESTNMVESLMCAREELDGPVLVSYADILFEDRVLRAAIEAPVEIGVTVDRAWREYWQARYGDDAVDTESLRIGSNGGIEDIGRPDPQAKDLDGRYVGLLKFGRAGTEALKTVYDETRRLFWGKPWRSARLFQSGYMTDLLQEMIAAGHRVAPIFIHKGWLEFDTEGDYEKACEWARLGDLDRFVDLQSSPGAR